MLWFRAPQKIYIKKGCLPVALDELKTVMGKKKAFIVTDNFLYSNGYTKPITDKLEEMGIDMDVDVDSVTIRESNVKLDPIEVTTNPYPGFATDIQQPLTALLTQAHGQSLVTETIYPERFKHCYELNKMGAKIDVRIPSAFVNGPTPLYGATVNATDLRCGACLVVAGLMAEGVTEIHSIYHIDRGYENLDGKLNALGAKVWRETV